MQRILQRKKKISLLSRKSNSLFQGKGDKKEKIMDTLGLGIILFQPGNRNTDKVSLSKTVKVEKKKEKSEVVVPKFSYGVSELSDEDF